MAALLVAVEDVAQAHGAPPSTAGVHPRHFLPVNRKPNRTEPKLRFIRFSVAGSVMVFVVFGVRSRLRFYTETEPNNRINRNTLFHFFIAGYLLFQ